MVLGDSGCKAGLLGVIDIVFANGNVQLVLHRRNVKTFDQSWLVEIVCIQEDDKISPCPYDTLISRRGNSRVIFRDDPYALIRSLFISSTAV